MKKWPFIYSKSVLEKVQHPQRLFTRSCQNNIGAGLKRFPWPNLWKFEHQKDKNSDGFWQSGLKKTIPESIVIVKKKKKKDQDGACWEEERRQEIGVAIKGICNCLLSWLWWCIENPTRVIWPYRIYIHRHTNEYNSDWENLNKIGGLYHCQYSSCDIML